MVGSLKVVNSLFCVGVMQNNGLVFSNLAAECCRICGSSANTDQYSLGNKGVRLVQSTTWDKPGNSMGEFLIKQFLAKCNLT